MFFRFRPHVILSGLIGLCILNSCGADEESKTRKAIADGVHFLTSIQREDGAICDTTDPLFDIWETIAGAEAIYFGEKDKDDLHWRRAMAFVNNNSNGHGMICHNMKCRKSYCLETTAEFLSFQRDIGYNIDNPAMMDSLMALQDSTGFWSIGNPDVFEEKNFPSVTGFVLNLIAKAKVDSVQKMRGLNWLLSRQNEEGHWGTAWEYYGCPAYALWANLRALSFYNSKEAEAARDRAVKYILRDQKEDGSWCYVMPGKKFTPSAELQAALMVISLSESEGNETESAMEKGIRFILDRQKPDGSWDGGFFPIDNKRFPKKEYVFATARCIDALVRWQQIQEGKKNR